MIEEEEEMDEVLYVGSCTYEPNATDAENVVPEQPEWRRNPLSSVGSPAGILHTAIFLDSLFERCFVQLSRTTSGLPHEEFSAWPT